MQKYDWLHQTVKTYCAHRLHRHINRRLITYIIWSFRFLHLKISTHISHWYIINSVGKESVQIFLFAFKRTDCNNFGYLGPNLYILTQVNSLTTKPTLICQDIDLKVWGPKGQGPNIDATSFEVTAWGRKTLHYDFNITKTMYFTCQDTSLYSQNKHLHYQIWSQ